MSGGDTPGPMGLAEALAELELFSEARPEELQRLADRLELRRVEPGDLVVAQGDPPEYFDVLLSGRVHISRTEADGRVTELDEAGAGSILGELALLTGEQRRASARVVEAGISVRGDLEDLGVVLSTTGVAERLGRTAAGRLAELVALVPVNLRGVDYLVRPLLPDDRDTYAAVLREQPAEWRRRRFFSPSPLSEAMIDRLVHIDLVDHFAWVVGLDEEQGVAVGRYIRSGADPTRAEVAFGVVDGWRSGGVGTFLLGAVAVAAREAGITELNAEVLHENVPMRAVFSKADARFRMSEPGVLGVSLEVEAAAALLDPDTADSLASAVRLVVTGAGLALVSGRRSGD